MKQKVFFLVLLSALLILCLGIIVIFLISVNHSPAKRSLSSQKTDTVIKGLKDSIEHHGLPPIHDTVLYINNRKVLIKTPGTHKKLGTFLVLHGWNLPPDDWCTKTTLCEKVTDGGYFLVLPDMGKSIYQERMFPETRIDWRSCPTRKWLTDTLVPFLQKNYSLFLENENNFIVGLSTGARGVVLVVLDLPKLFRGAAALSGDYNQSNMTKDKLITGYFGPYKKFRSRWDNKDNASFRINDFQTPIYLGHGISDKVVPPDQTKVFYAILVKAHPLLKIKLNMPKAGHNYLYWGSEVDNILQFFKGLK